MTGVICWIDFSDWCLVFLLLYVDELVRGCLCQTGIEITDYTGDKISVGVAGPSHVLGQSVPCDG